MLVEATCSKSKVISYPATGVGEQLPKLYKGYTTATRRNLEARAYRNATDEESRAYTSHARDSYAFKDLARSQEHPSDAQAL